MKKSVKVAIVQKGPVYQDLEKSLEKMLALIEEAVAGKAELIVFGETWLSGYPAWLDHCTDYARWDFVPTKKAFSKMYQNSVSVNGEAIKSLCESAKKHQVVIVTGINEIVEKGIGNGTIYNALLIINSDGQIVNHHRKLMPTFTEKLLYGIGDGNGLKAADTSLGRIGSLICWEHWMPLARQAMHNSGELIHIALWPQVHEMLQLASRHYAFEGRCFVIAVGQMMKASDFPSDLELPEQLQKESNTYVLNGGSSIIGPDGKYLLEPQFDNEKIIFFEIDNLEKALEEKMTLDTSGHYNRHDVFDFKVSFERKT
jgi:predicted amidohydrolase